MILNEPNYRNAMKHIDEALDKGGLPKQTYWDLKFLRAGLKAEKQVAYQLKTYFGDTEKIHAFNNFKFEHNDQTVQIDHLVFNKGGFFVIESKSISGAIEVNEFSEWHRIYGKKRTPIKSPVEQAKRQSELFHKLLEANVTQICGKLIGLQKHFGSYSNDQYVSISEENKSPVPISPF